MFLDQNHYATQVGVSPSSDYRSVWKGNLKTIWWNIDENHFTFVLKKTAVDASVAPVIGWIKKGWLKATPRGDTIADHGGPGDRWNITPKAVRAFLLENAALINPRGINFVWLMDLLRD